MSAPQIIKVKFPGTVQIPSGHELTQVVFLVHKDHSPTTALLPGAKGNLGAVVQAGNGVPSTSLFPGPKIAVGVEGDKIQTVVDGKPVAVDAIEIAEPLRAYIFRAIKAGLWELEQPAA